jgi:hypothetical protein
MKTILTKWLKASFAGLLLNLTLIMVFSQFLPGVYAHVSNTTGEIPTNTIQGLTESNIDILTLPSELTGSDTDRIKAITTYLKIKGEEKNIDQWLKIIKGESKYGRNLVPDTYWSLCDRPVIVTLWGYKQPANSFIELRDYPDGRVWQDNCEYYGAVTIDRGYSVGLLHVILPTWNDFNCSGDRMNWIDNLDCAIKIKDARGFGQWSTN